MFADDAKIQRKIIAENSCLELQNDLTKLYEWSKKWQMEFKAENFHVKKFGKKGMRPDWEYKLGKDSIQESEKEKDLGVVINNRLSPEEHIQEKVRNTHNLITNMRVAFTYIDEDNNYIIYTSYA